MKFIVDGMFGKLSRWLRLAGHDVAYVGDEKLPPEEQDDALLERAKTGERILITADLDLHKRAVKAGLNSIFIGSIDIALQLVEVSKHVGARMEIKPENSKCPMCNGTLETTNKNQIEGLVPANVLKNNDEFWRCSKCGKIYWHGGHWKNITEMASRYNDMVK